MVPSELGRPDGQPIRPNQADHSSFVGSLALPSEPHLPEPSLHYNNSSHPQHSANQLFPASGSMTGQQAPVARHLGIRLETGQAEGNMQPGGSGGGGGRVESAASRRNSANAHSPGPPMIGQIGIGQPYASSMDDRQGPSVQHYRPYAGLAPTPSDSGSYAPPVGPHGGAAFPSGVGYSNPYGQHPRQSPIQSPVPQPQQFHPQYQQPYPSYHQLPPQNGMSIPPGYPQPPAMMDNQAGSPMYAPGPAQLGQPHSHLQPHQQQPHQPFPITSAFATQQGTFYFMPRQPPGAPPSHPQYSAPLPPPLGLAPSSAGNIYELPNNGHPGHPGPHGNRPPMASGMAMSMPLSASSSNSSLTPTNPAHPSHKRHLPDPSDPNAAPRPKPKKKKAKSAKDQPKRFLCEYEGCGRAFARQFNLQTHAKSHYNIRDYDCAHCDKKFSRRHDRGRHCAAVHPEALNEDLGGRGGSREEGDEGSGEEYPDVSGLVLP